MDEYINRKTALENIKKIYELGGFPTGRDAFETINNVLATMSAADVAEVVRCKDCKHCDFGEWQFAVCAKRSEYHNFTVRKNEFCNFGERRESE